MSKREEEVIKSYFDPTLTDRERAIFEGGVALGSIYHQFLGVPIIKDDEILKALENAIEKTMSVQPYREKIEVKIIRDKVKSEKKNQYDYESLKGAHLDIKVVVKYGKYRVTARMKRMEEIDYNLMCIEKIEKLSEVI
ncbi:MAG: dihydroneopterin aldolase family protein [Nitrososphaerales archaeon]